MSTIKVTIKKNSEAAKAFQALMDKREADKKAMQSAVSNVPKPQPKSVQHNI